MKFLNHNNHTVMLTIGNKKKTLTIFMGLMLEKTADSVILDDDDL